MYLARSSSLLAAMFNYFNRLATKMVKLTESLQAACSGTEDCTSRSACAQTKEVGPCRGNFPRWSDECDGCSDDDDSNYYADTIMLDDY